MGMYKIPENLDTYCYRNSIVWTVQHTGEREGVENTSYVLCWWAVIQSAPKYWPSLASLLMEQYSIDGYVNVGEHTCHVADGVQLWQMRCHAPWLDTTNSNTKYIMNEFLTEKYRFWKDIGVHMHSSPKPWLRCAGLEPTDETGYL